MPKNGPIWASFLQAETCGQTELPDRSLLIRQNLMENAKKWSNFGEVLKS